MAGIAEPPDKYGGEWTLQKLKILRKYLDAYTTALKNQSFGLVYIDAFAGTGQVQLENDDEDTQGFIDGSTNIALNIADKPFDRLIFIEKNANRCIKLEQLRQKYPGSNIEIRNGEANDFLKNFELDWSQWRGVLFLDPFATQVEWATIERIATFEALDTWILFPLYAITRMLPKDRTPDSISPAWAKRLTGVFGDESWRGLYKESPQQSLFNGESDLERDPGSDRILDIYKDKLRSLFGERFLESSKDLRNSKNLPIFEFLFCAGNPRGSTIAKKIAGHIIENF